MIKECIERLVMMEDLSPEAMTSAMEEVMSGQATPAQVASFITALRMKGETVEEISCAARVMQGKAIRLHLPGVRLIDTCGTGGDGAMTFNISTAAALVVSAAGMPVAKHGNRAVSSRCGSADVLEALGVRVDLEPARVEDCIREVGIGFLFAPTFHLAMKHAAPIRREIGVRTIFNVLGPLTNPAGAPVQLMGVFSAELAKKLAHALHHMGNRSAYVVHGAGGLDELSLHGPNLLYAVTESGVVELSLEASELGINPAPVEELRGGTAQENAAVIRQVFEGATGPRRDVILLNAGAAIAAASHQETSGASPVDIIKEIENGIRIAARAIDSGAAQDKLKQLVGFTQGQVVKRQEMDS